jgi:hypothetical protein
VTSASNYFCAFTNRPADHFHHVTARDAKGVYLDPDLRLPLVAVQHHREHQSWGPSFRDLVEGDADVLRLQRMGSLDIRLGEHHQGGYVVFPAFYVVQRGLTLHGIARSLESRT